MRSGSYRALLATPNYSAVLIAQFSGAQIFKTITIALLLFVGTLWPPGRPRRAEMRSRLLLVVPAVSIVMFTLITYVRGGHGLYGQPGAIIPLAYTPLLIFDLSQFWRRENVKIPLTDGDERNYDIVLLIDESVRADYLDIVASDGLVSNLLGEPSISNYGISASATNCCTGTNLILRFGGTRTEYDRYIKGMPSMWQYAHAAGFRTVYVDGQRTDGRLHNGMTDSELSDIDEFVQLHEIPIVGRDIEIAHVLTAYSKNQRNELIIVNKMGAHFPVHDKYPDDFMIHTPAPARGRFIAIADTGDRTGFGEWPAYINAYKNTLLWNVGHFFKVYLENVDLENTVIIYTSDHGQNFHEDGSPGFGTQCSAQPVPQEGLVYTVLITEQPAWKNAFREWSAENFDRTSHYNIFPTILNLMGYDKKPVQDTYGPSLLEPTNDEMTFNSRFNARFGGKPKWNKIDYADSGS